MPKLNQIIAIEKGGKAQAYSLISDLYKTVQKAELFNGFTKTYEKLDVEGEDLPSENKKAQATVSSVILKVIEAQTDSWQTTARKEFTNQHARADIVVDGQVLLPDVPVTFLLQLEKSLVDLRSFISAIPTLDENENWDYDPNSGLYKTQPVKTGRTKKIQKAIVLYDATPEHPAQTQLITEDILAGYWNTTKMSGALPVPEKERLMARVERLVRAVKMARETANQQDEVGTPPVGPILTYLFEGLYH